MRIGFIGLGNAGSKLAGCLLRNGVELHVRDLDRAAAEPLIAGGAIWEESGCAMAQTCEAVIIVLPSPEVSAAVLDGPDGVLEGLGEGKLWIEMSTTEAADVRRLGALVEQRGARTVDAPVSGGCHRAKTGNIAIFAGGTREAFEQALPILSIMGREIVHTGELGSASILKVITNYLAGVSLVATGEAFMVAKKSGLDLGVAWEAIRISAGNSYTHETEAQMILSGVYAMNFTIDHNLKDLTLFSQLGERLAIPLELAPVVVNAIQDGIDRYGPRAWSPMVVKRLEDDCGEELRAEGFPEEMVDFEPEAPGYEVVIQRRGPT